MSQVANWCFTSFKDDIVVPDHHNQFVYCVYQREVAPETQKEHWQGYIEFKRSVKMNVVKQLFNDNALHLEPRQGTRDQARAYCMKEDTRKAGTTPTEVGEWVDKNSGKRTDLEAFAKLVMEGKKDYELAEAMPSTFGRHKRMVDTLRLAKKPQMRQPPEVTVIYGDPGTGKTRSVYDSNDLEDIFSMEGEYKWFDGYEGQPVVLFDEFCCQFKLSFLLQLLDRYPIRVAVKGGFVNWTPTKIYITSNSSPEAWYHQCLPVQRAALLRRIGRIIKLEEHEDVIIAITEKPSPVAEGDSPAQNC